MNPFAGQRHVRIIKSFQSLCCRDLICVVSSSAHPAAVDYQALGEDVPLSFTRALICHCQERRRHVLTQVRPRQSQSMNFCLLTSLCTALIAWAVNNLGDEPHSLDEEPYKRLMMRLVALSLILYQRCPRLTFSVSRSCPPPSLRSYRYTVGWLPNNVFHFGIFANRRWWRGWIQHTLHTQKCLAGGGNDLPSAGVAGHSAAGH